MERNEAPMSRAIGCISNKAPASYSRTALSYSKSSMKQSDEMYD